MERNDSLSDLETLFRTQREAHRGAPFAPWEVRRDRLARLQRMIRENEDAIEQSIDQDFGGRPAIETEVAEIYPSLAEIRSAMRGGRRWMKPRSAWVSKWFLPARARIVPRPVGVVGIIVPWNYPLFLTMGPLAGALAAGNRAMLKISEYTPRFGLLMQRLFAEHFGADEIAVVNGGPEVGARFASLPFDHLVFTGSTAVGRKVMTAAGANLTPVTLELGGKSPTVIAPGYPLRKAAERVVVGKLLNAGQTCIAPDYVLVQRDALDAFAHELAQVTREMYPLGLDDSDYCSIIDRRQYARLVGYLDEARDAGTRAVDLFDGPQRDDDAHRFGPVLLLDPPDSLRAMTDEIFGPILPLVPYDAIDDALAYVNARPHPLALYWFDNDRARAEEAIRSTHVGGACVNETLLHIAQDSLPFGGIGPSGMGHYHGKWGFDAMSKLTPVFHQSPLNGMGLFMPPYRPIARKLLALMKRF